MPTHLVLLSIEGPFPDRGGHVGAGPGVTVDQAPHWSSLGTRFDLEESIAAVVVGGVALTGGKGTVLGVCLGVITLALISNGLDLINVSSYLQMVVIGAIIVFAVIVDQFRTGKKG